MNTKLNKLYKELAKTANTLFDQGMTVDEVYGHLKAKGMNISQNAAIVIATEWVLRN